MQFRIRSSLAFAAAVLTASTAFAQSSDHDKYSGAPLPPDKKRQVPSPITDRFYVRGTVFPAKLATDLRVDSSTNLPGTVVSGERDLGLRASKVQGRMELMFRLRERNRLRVDYFETDRSGQKVLSRTVDFGNEVFNINDLAATSLDVRMFGLTYTYSLLRTERFELGTGLGVYFIEGDARGQVPARQLSQEVSGVAPFPTLALDGTWRISTRFAFVARAQYLRATVNGNSGSLGDYHADFQYRWRPNFALGLGYSELKMLLQVTGGSFPGQLDLSVKGPEAFFRVSF